MRLTRNPAMKVKVEERPQVRKNLHAISSRMLLGVHLRRQNLWNNRLVSYCVADWKLSK